MLIYCLCHRFMEDGNGKNVNVNVNSVWNHVSTLCLVYHEGNFLTRPDVFLEISKIIINGFYCHGGCLLQSTSKSKPVRTVEEGIPQAI